MRFFPILFAISAFAQFSNLVTTTDGSQLYFSSTLQLSGSSDTTSDPKIFWYDGTKIRLSAHLAKVSSTPPNLKAGQVSIDSNYYSLQSPFTSGNGSVTGFVGYADCLGCTYARVLPAQTTFQFAGALGELVLPYECNVSTNGRYALCLTGQTPGYATPSLLIDLTTLQSSAFNTWCIGDPHFITSSGQVLLGSQGPPELWSASGSRTLPIVARPCGLISNDGSLIVHNTDSALAVYNVASGTDTVLGPNLVVNGTTYFPELMGISDDARWILAEVYDGAAWHLTVLDSSNGPSRQLTVPDGGVQFSGGRSSVTISGDGSTVYAVSANGSLFNIQVQSGATQQIVTSQPLVTSISGAPVPGSLNQILGSGLTGSSVTLNGSQIRVLAAYPNLIDVQIPWETPLGNASLQVFPASPTPFQQVLPLQIVASQPAVAFPSPIAGNFTGLNSSSTPAHGGDDITFYLTGLGAVAVPVADGAPSPSSPLPLLRNPITVTYGTAPISVLYAGLAPALIGVYQVTVQLPQKIPNTLPFPSNPTLVPIYLMSGSLTLPTVWAVSN
jgi:uncharacterized protein (TIGR03437 family)